ncbi:MAG: hypothetical protein AB7U20_05565 [Planctomycetaceae bacterium]
MDPQNRARMIWERVETWVASSSRDAFFLAAAASALWLPGCGGSGSPIREDDPEAVVALINAGAEVDRVPNMSAPNMLGRNVDVTGTDLNDELFQHLGQIEGLIELKLASPEVTDDTLAKLPELKTVTTVDLTGASITDEGLAHLESLPALFSLNLSDTKVTAAGLAKLRPLAILTLTNLPIGDDDLESLQHMKGLAVLTLAGTNVTPAGVNQMRQTRPRLLVVGIKMN